MQMLLIIIAVFIGLVLLGLYYALVLGAKADKHIEKIINEDSDNQSQKIIRNN